MDKNFVYPNWYYGPYDTSDLAAIQNRLIDEKGDILLYVIDAGQVSEKKNLNCLNCDAFKVRNITI